MHKKVSKWIKQSKQYISITKTLYHAMSLTVLSCSWNTGTVKPVYKDHPFGSNMCYFKIDRLQPKMGLFYTYKDNGEFFRIEIRFP